MYESEQKVLGIAIGKVVNSQFACNTFAKASVSKAGRLVDELFPGLHDQPGTCAPIDGRIQIIQNKTYWIEDEIIEWQDNVKQACHAQHLYRVLH